MTISAMTMAAPAAPSGLRRTNRPAARAPRRIRPCRRGRTIVGAAPPTSPPSRVVCMSPPSRRPSITDPRVEHGVEGVDRQVEEDDGGDDDEVHALDDRVVAVVDGVEQE